MITIKRKFEFDAGHRVLGHEGKCANLHGHRYTAEFEITAVDLDKLDRVIDYSEIKRVIGGWIDANLDHTTLLHPEDPLWDIEEKVLHSLFPNKRPFVMPNGNPTAENIASFLHDIMSEKLAVAFPEHELSLLFVHVWETPNCCASACLDFPESDCGGCCGE